jgi:hypothetical protein
MQDATAIERIRLKFLALNAVFDERSRRQWAAAEAREYGYGGVTAVATATGLARDTIAAGLRELEYRECHPVLSAIRAVFIPPRRAAARSPLEFLAR